MFSCFQGVAMTSEVYDILGFKTNPFPPGACKDFYFQTESSKRFLDEIMYGVMARKGFIVLVGEVGLGKTSLLLQLLPLLETEEVHTSWVFNTMLDKNELLRALARDFGLPLPEGSHLAEILDALHLFFLEQNKDGHNCAIVIDEAHLLEFSTMEVLRMLSNLELNGEKLVQILLVGQPELKTMLGKPEMRQFRSRINIFLEFPALTKAETDSYVNFKFSMSGSELKLSGRALHLVWRASAGNFRLINLIMEKTIYAMVAFNERKITSTLVMEALKDIAAWNRDLAGRIRMIRLTRFSMASSAIAAGLLFAIIGLAFYFSGGKKRPAEPLAPAATVETAPQASESTTAPAQTAKPISTPSTTQQAETAETVLPAPVPEPVAKAPAPRENPTPATTIMPAGWSRTAGGFLDLWGLGQLEPALRQAVAEKNLAVFEKKLNEAMASSKNRVTLIQLDSAPPVPRVSTATLFEWKEYAGVGPNYLAMWKPPVLITKFVSGFKSPDIEKLQLRLDTLGFYHGAMDGKAGPSMQRAIAAFQKENGLKETGEPDPGTLFWLYSVPAPSGDKKPRKPEATSKQESAEAVRTDRSDKADRMDRTAPPAIPAEGARPNKSQGSVPIYPLPRQ
jgi:type II secretory pathway predicted ATPase ExeA